MDTAHYNVCALAESFDTILKRIVAVPGTWRGGASRGQYWRGDAVPSKTDTDPQKTYSLLDYIPDPLPYPKAEIDRVPVEEVAHRLAQTRAGAWTGAHDVPASGTILAPSSVVPQVRPAARSAVSPYVGARRIPWRTTSRRRGLPRRTSPS